MDISKKDGDFEHKKNVYHTVYFYYYFWQTTFLGYILRYFPDFFVLLVSLRRQTLSRIASRLRRQTLSRKKESEVFGIVLSY